MPIDAETVIEGYRLLLGRDPESEAMIAQQCGGHESASTFLRQLVESEEYKGRQPRGVTELAQIHLERPSATIEVETSPETLSRLLERVQRQWMKLGQDDPYWSVITDDRFRRHRLDEEAMKIFFKSGEFAAKLLPRFETAAGTRVKRGTCFELGCGVGRITYWLSKQFDRVIAADISIGNLALCRENLAAKGVTNVDFLLIDSFSKFEEVDEFDCLYSMIVLQHNPPPVQLTILDALLPKISSEGGCLFQTPDQLPDYSFSADAYLREPEEQMGMHALPMADVLRALQRHRLLVLGVAMDGWTGAYGSYTYFATKS